MRECTQCGELKPPGEFYARKNGAVSASCKACTREERRRYRAEHPDRVRGSLKKSRDKHLAQRRADAKRWREANPDKVAAIKSRARAKDPEAAARRTRQWREANPEKAREGRRNWYAANRESAKQKERDRRARLGREVLAVAHKEWRSRNPAAWTALIRKRRARRHGLDLRDVSPAFLAELFAAFDHLCAYCNEADATTVDHYIPLKLGGLHAMDNLAPACLSCNTSKGALHPEKWLYHTYP